MAAKPHHLQPHHLHGAFGEDTFGRFAEKTARFFGTPKYILGQTVIVLLWIALNSFALIHHWDPNPFIMLNLIFSTQAAYAAPLILLAQTRQADRDKVEADRVDARHTELETSMKGETDKLLELLQSSTTLTQQDTDLTEQVAALTREIHALLTKSAPAG
ncbi:MAG TPA: DUF1003 domain-containing protein [Gaiellaceae bacterium]|nr:DUF1003 domain-containing protein [Gaiellaceae bacterium]